MGVLSFLLAAGLRYFAFTDTVIGDTVGPVLLPRDPSPAHAAQRACKLLNETLPRIVAFPGQAIPPGIMAGHSTNS